jgi:predicted transcriptional regulator
MMLEVNIVEAELKVGIKSDDEFFAEAREIARKLDTGWRPELPIERLYFDDLPTLLKYLTPKRFELLNILHSMGHVSINALAKKLHRQYRNVFYDVKILERLGLVEKDEENRFFVLWDEIDATFRLAA